MVAFARAFTNVRAATVSYFLSFVCDELDGRFARRCDQCSAFGGVLDMITDRLATCALLMILAMEYSEWYMLAVGLLALDISSHWVHQYVQLLTGRDSHKDVSTSKFAILRAYYTNRIFMGFCCVSVEVMYLCLHALKQAPQWRGFAILPPNWMLAYAAIPGFVVKQCANVAQLVNACETLVAIDRLSIAFNDDDDDDDAGKDE
jgi:CDP-diacylglycerol--inositol 3-phosphatidyltransferase